MFASRSFGRFTSGIFDLTAGPRVCDAAKPPVIYMGGGSVTAITGLLAAESCMAALQAQGFRVYMPSVPILFGNATAMSRIDDTLTYAHAHGSGSADPVLVGLSNGGICAMQYARTHAVAAVITVITPVDLEYARAIGGQTRTDIDAAWGVTYPTALPANADLWTDQAAYVGKPIQMWVSTDDPFDDGPNTEQAFATAVGADFQSLGAVGHADASWSGVDISDVVDFVVNHV